MHIEKRDKEMRLLKAAGWTLRELSERYGLNSGHIGRIVRDAQLADLTDPGQTSRMQELKDQKAYAMGRVRTELRMENIVRRCTEIACSEVKPFEPVDPPSPRERKGKIQAELAGIISDGHHDQVVRREEVGNLEEYTFPISLRRGQAYVDRLIRYDNSTIHHDYRRLTLFDLGDSTSGEIHNAEQKSAFGNQFKNCTAIARLKAAMYRDLCSNFPEIEVFCTSGNHGRRTPRKEYAGGAHNNWDYMVNSLTRDYLADQPNIKFHIPDSWDVITDIQGFTFHASHGDDVASSGGHPWEGLAKFHKANSGIHRGTSTNKPFCDGSAVDYYCIGHHHSLGYVDWNGVGFFCNGAWPATDPFAYQCLRVAGRPQQLIWGVHKDKGATMPHSIHLDGHDYDKKCRYDKVLRSIEGLEYCLNAPRADGKDWVDILRKK